VKERGHPERIRRILVALDASPQSMAALRAAAELAALLNAELVGLFVEDINLLRISEYSYAREIGHFSAHARKIDAAKMGRLLRVTARRAHQSMRIIARETRVRWSFTTRRGSIAPELLQAAEDSDLVILGRTGWSKKPALGSTVRQILDDPPARTLIIKDETCLTPSILALFNNSPASYNALASALELSRGRQTYLTVGIVARDSAQAREFQSAAHGWLQERATEARFRWLVGLDLNKVQWVVQEEDSTLVIPIDVPALSEAVLTDMIESLECAIMVVR
jgi:nucleotide-binding universal stress UspA family protein